MPWSFSFTYEGIVREKIKNRKMKKQNLYHSTYVDQKHPFVQSGEIHFSINFFWMVWFTYVSFYGCWSQSTLNFWSIKSIQFVLCMAQRLFEYRILEDNILIINALVILFHIQRHLYINWNTHLLSMRKLRMFALKGNFA